MSVDPVYFVIQGVLALPLLLGLVLISIMVRGGARVLGISGCLVVLLSRIANASWSYLWPQLRMQVGPDSPMPWLIGAGTNLVLAIGVILLVCAVVTGRRRTVAAPAPGRTFPQPPPAPGPYAP